jgi:hypothetical protein
LYTNGISNASIQTNCVALLHYVGARITAILLATAAVAGCGGGDVAKPLASSAEKTAAREAAVAAAGADHGAGSSGAARRWLQTMWHEDEGVRAAMCRHLDVVELNHSQPSEREYLAYEQASAEVIPYSEFLDVIGAVDQLSDGDSEWLRSVACL